MLRFVAEHIRTSNAASENEPFHLQFPQSEFIVDLWDDFFFPLEYNLHVRATSQPCFALLRRRFPFPILTPSDQYVPPEVFPLGNKCEGQQGLQIHALNQQPEVIGQDTELEESHGRLARRLGRKQQNGAQNSRCTSLLYVQVLFFMLKILKQRLWPLWYFFTSGLSSRNL